MEIMEVRRPQQQSPMQRMMGIAGTGVGNTMTGIQVGKGISSSIPWVKAKIAEMGGSEGAGAAAGEEGAASAAGPIGLMALATYGDYRSTKAQMSGDKSDPYYNFSAPRDKRQIKAPTWNYDTVDRRRSQMQNLNAKDILSARNSVKDLPLSEPDKINIGNKLSEMLKFIKIG